jgi:hypothetical protein
MNKKAQAEIMGLIVIVILVVVAMIFVLQFTVLRKPETVKTYSDIEIANNMLTSLLQTTTDCHGLTFTDLLKDCAATEDVRCDDNMKSCAYLDETVNYLFNNTLDEWGRSYNFTAILPDRAALGFDVNPIVLTKASGYCTGEIIPAQPHLISVAGSIMTIYLDMCD